MKRKVVAMILVAGMAAAMLAGCGNKNASQTAAQTDAPAETETAVEEESAPAESAEPESTEEASDTRTVTDRAGVDVEIPAEVDSYVDSWFAHNAIAVMLDQAEGMKVTCCDPNAYQWMYLVCENMSNAEFAEFSDTMNVEEIIAQDPDVVFGSNENYRAMFENAGIPFVNCQFSNYDEMRESITLSGEVLGKQDIAEAYIGYLDDNIAKVESALAEVADEDKPTVLHVNNAEALKVDGSNTIIDQWITMAGGVNAAAEVEGNMMEVTMEQILSWDPDVLIIQEPADVELIKSDSTWSSLRAVQEGKIYCNPKGVFAWDRYGVEEALQVLWCAQQLYPDQFADQDMVSEVKDFYKEFFKFDLTDEQAQKILDHENP